MIRICLEEHHIRIQGSAFDLEPRDESQLAYWGFSVAENGDWTASTDNDVVSPLRRLSGYFMRRGIQYEMDEGAANAIDEWMGRQEEYIAAVERGRRFKAGEVSISGSSILLDHLSTRLARPLKQHQVKSALHLWHTLNGANFSVPGSGKTSVVLAVYTCLKALDRVDAIFVVGPPACFTPWRTEYELVTGSVPNHEILAGGNVEIRQEKYLVNKDTVADLYLTTFQTLERDHELVRMMFANQGLRFYLVIDEAHYIKQVGGTWAHAVSVVAPMAEYRCVLTGTPFPRSLTDAFNLFDVLWPAASPIPTNDKRFIELQASTGNYEVAVAKLDESIGPLFYRVRKSELGLAPQVFHDPLVLKMNEVERRVYDAIFDRVKFLSKSDSPRDFDLMDRLKRGRMMRLRQCLSYAGLLSTAIDEYDEDIVPKGDTIHSMIAGYDALEIPVKLGALRILVAEILCNTDRLVVWSNFIRTLEMITRSLEDAGYGVRLIFGGTPFQSTTFSEEQTRDEIISEFTDSSSDIQVLVANPAACAESISLHKACQQAIYYDLSYNCAQYLQSLDRIHRVGGSEKREAHYHFLQYADTIESDILGNLQDKARNMAAVIDKEYGVYSLDMFSDEDELSAYSRIFEGEHD